MLYLLETHSQTPSPVAVDRTAAPPVPLTKQLVRPELHARFFRRLALALQTIKAPRGFGRDFRQVRLPPPPIDPAVHCQDYPVPYTVAASLAHASVQKGYDEMTRVHHERA